MLEEELAKLFLKKKKTLSIAESCTGGLICHRLTNIPGSSKFFKAGLIVYSNETKIHLLKIPSQTLQKYGAVSEVVAEKMSQNIRQLLQTDFGVGITGIAGPTGGSVAKPVGLIFISVSSKEKTICRKFIFKGSRLKIKTQAAMQALKMLLIFLCDRK